MRLEVFGFISMESKWILCYEALFFEYIFHNNRRKGKESKERKEKEINLYYIILKNMDKEAF